MREEHTGKALVRRQHLRRTLKGKWGVSRERGVEGITGESARNEPCLGTKRGGRAGLRAGAARGRAAWLSGAHCLPNGVS